MAILILPGNANPSNVLAGTTFSAGANYGAAGTMPENGATGGTITTQGGTINIPSGHTTGGVVDANISNLIAGNIKDNVNVGGVVGTFSETASPASATQILANRVAFANGAQVTGTMPNRGSVGTQTISSQNGEYTILAGWHNGLGKVKAFFANLITSNIKSGVNVGGVIGTLVPLSDYVAGTDILYTDGTQKIINSTIPTKVKEVTLIEGQGIFRIVYNIKSGFSGYVVKGGLYINGTSSGIVRQTSSTTSVEYTEDISLLTDDKLQLYIWNVDDTTVESNQFNIGVTTIKPFTKNL